MKTRRSVFWQAWIAALLIAVGLATTGPGATSAQVDVTATPTPDVSATDPTATPEPASTATPTVDPGPGEATPTAEPASATATPTPEPVSDTPTPTPDTAPTEPTPTATPTSSPEPSPTDTPVPSATPTATSTPTTSDLAYSENSGGGGGKNLVLLQNVSDDRFQMRAAIQLNRVPGPTVDSTNLAQAYSSCVDCQSLAVAMQLNLISKHTRRATPQNAAVAVNANCTSCTTVALALQYVLSVEDPTQVPPEVNQLISDMRNELNAISKDKRITVWEAEARVQAVVDRFRQLADSLDEQRDETTEVNSPAAA